MRFVYLLAVVLPMSFLSGCANTPDIEIHPVDTAAIGTFTTFEVIPDRRDSPLGPMRTRQTRVQIEKALGEEMQRKGYRQVESGADIQIEYVTYITEEYQEQHEKRYELAGMVIDQHLPEPRDVPLRIGTLHVHLLHDGKALYEALASGLVNGEVTMERIRLAAKGLLAEVPPAPLMGEPSGKRPGQ